MPSYTFAPGAINTVTAEWATELGLGGERLVAAEFEAPAGLTAIGTAFDDDTATLRFAVDADTPSGQTYRIQHWVRTSAGNRWPLPIFVIVP